MSMTEMTARVTGIRARLERLLNTNVPFDHYSVGALLDAAWEVSCALDAQHDPKAWELWEGILVAHEERA